MLKTLIKKVQHDNSLKIITEFSFLQFFFWGSWAIYGSYLVYYLTDIGYSNMQIGTMMSIRTFMGLISPPILGYITDKIKNRKIVFIVSMAILGIIVTPFPLYGNIAVVIVISLTGFFWDPQQSILDSWILETSVHSANNYGFMRAWGSIGYALIVTIFGQIIEKTNWSVHYFSYGITILIVVLLALIIKDNSYVNSKKNHSSEAKSSENKDLLKLFKNVNYLFVLFITLLIFIPNQMIFVYLAPIIRSVGGDAADLGYVLFFNALSEAPVFFAAKSFLVKYKTKSLLLISAIFYLIRIIIAALAVSPAYFIIFGLLQSLSYGVYLITIRYYVKLIAPEGLKTTAQSITLMSGFGAGGIIGSLLGGYLIDNFGMKIMFAASIILSSLAVVILLGAVLKKNLL